MKRSKQFVLLAHCILNVNAKVDGLAMYAGVMPRLTQALIDSGFGIMQLPCPEQSYYGPRRWGQVKQQMDSAPYRKHCRALFEPYLLQLQDYIADGYQPVALIGIDGSPSCGVAQTCSAPTWRGEDFVKTILPKAQMVSGAGVFIEEIRNMLTAHCIAMPFLAINEMDPAQGLDVLITTLRELS